ncbi:MAG TPA: ShlB/FhaC/HecB family hemolysin secretion/activation protein, partial [Spirochaetota bacterium]
TDRKYSRCYTASFSFPVGYWSIASTWSRSKYMQFIQGLNTEFQSSGSDTNKSLSIDRLMWRYKYGRFKLKSSLTLKNKKNFIEDSPVDASTRKLSVLRVGGEYSDFMFGGYFSTGAYYYRGLKYFGAYKDKGEMKEDTPRAQFNKYELTLLWNKPFSIARQNFGYLIIMDGQFTNKTLYSSEKMSIGDVNTIRGFREGVVVGDRGYFIRNEVSINDFSSIWTYLKGAKIFIGYDNGYVVEKAGKKANYGQGKARLSGCASGFTYSSALTDFNITYARRISSPSFVKADKYVVYFSVMANLSGALEEGWKYAISD